VWDATVVVDETTNFQNVVIGKTSLGMTLFCDGQRQSSKHTSDIYHEGQTIPGLLLCGQSERAAVIGCSEGVAVHILEQYFGKVTHVDIDQRTVELCAQHLDYGYTALELSDRMAKKKLVFEDGYAWLANQDKQSLDLICLDIPEFVPGAGAQHNRLYSEDFFKLVQSRLTVGGVFITEAGCPTLWRNESLVALYRRMQKVFGGVVYFDMVEQEWAWIMGRRVPSGYDATLAAMAYKMANLTKRPKWVNFQTLKKGLVLPAYLRD
jgi:spermidine synthase